MNMEPSDRILLQRFARHHDEEAFRKLMQRHLGLVHGVALRVTANADLAKDAAQDTFVRLARRATLIPDHVPLAAWLHRTCRSLAIDLVRAEEARRKYQMKAVAHSTDPMPAPAWTELAPVVDELVDLLPGADRKALLLRFYQNLSFPEIGDALGLSEEAARQRALRALGKLRRLLGRRGIATTSAALAALLPAHAAPLPPADLSASLLQAAGTVTPSIPPGLISRLLAMTSTHKYASACAGLILVATIVYTRPWSGGETSTINSVSKQDALHSETGAEAAIIRDRQHPDSSSFQLERLRKVLSIEDPIQRRQEMISLIDQIPPARFEEACDACLRLGLKNRQDEQTLLDLAWTRFDPISALNWGEKHGLSEKMAGYWATFDPDDALAWAKAGTNTQPIPQEQEKRFTYVLAGIARVDPGLALKLACEATQTPNATERELQMAPAGNRMRQLRGIYCSLATDSDAMEMMLAGTADDSLRSDIINTAASEMGNKDPVAAARLLLDHPSAAYQSVAAQNNSIDVFLRWLKLDQDAVIQNIISAPESVRTAVLPAVTLNIASADPERAFALLADCPAKDYDWWVDDVINRLLSYSSAPADVTGKFARIENEGLRDRAMTVSLRQWLKQDAPAARSWMEANAISQTVIRNLR